MGIQGKEKIYLQIFKDFYCEATPHIQNLKTPWMRDDQEYDVDGRVTLSNGVNLKKIEWRYVKES